MRLASEHGDPPQPSVERGTEDLAAAEELGFHAAYIYDHLSWRSFRDEPWFGAVPTLTAEACVTERLRLGTLVTSVKPRSPIAA
jgi:alkanesulfonate monooxygenase SsuD/methylene tetrahydromethanopterin reductase-like flavin-dependent oxidoreductase (luciferase family)